MSFPPRISSTLRTGLGVECRYGVIISMSRAVLHLVLPSLFTTIISKLARKVKSFLALYALFLQSLSSRYKGIILCFKYYFRLSPPLRDYMVYTMTIFLTWMVGSLGLAPSGSKTPVLQTGPLLVTVYLPICGGADKNRTCYPLRAREILYQMSYSPKNKKAQ